MDCDDALVLLAAREVRTLSHREEAQLASHAATCETCRAVRAADDDESWWIMRATGEPADEPVVPTVNPNVFVVGEEVAAGGMGRVLRARDRRLGREVAIKESLDPKMHARFEREALITAQLQHPAIVPIYEAGMWPDGTRFYTMRLVPGQTLAGAIAEAASLEARLALLRHVIAATEAVAHAHGQRIIHRDLKPGNILVGELGETVVIDWGIARRLDHDDEVEPAASRPALEHPLTRAGSVLGTPGFMAPEQARGEPLDARADVFALGAILYNLIVGEMPYAYDGDVEKLVARTGSAPAPSIDLAAGDAPKDLRVIVAKAMAFDLADRYPDARAMADDLRRFETGQLIARRYRTSELIARWVRRHTAAVSIAVLAVLALGIGGVVFVRGLAEARDVAEIKQTEAEAARVVADRERAASELALTRSLEDQGRQALLAGSADRALVLLAEARRRGSDTPALRHLLAAALRDRGLVRKRIELKAQSAPLAIALTERELIAVGEDKVRSYGDDKQKIPLVRGASDAVVLPNGTDVVMLSARDVSRHRLTTQTMKWAVPVEPAPGARLVAAPDRIAIATREALLVLDLAAGTKLATVPFPDATSYAFSADGKWLAAANQAGELRLWDDRFAPRASWSAGEELSGLVVLGGDRVVAAGASSVVLWSRGAGPRRLAHALQAPLLGFAPATGIVAAGDRKGRVVAWSSDGDELGSSYVHEAITALAFSPDGSQLAASDGDRTLVYDSHALAPIAELATPEARTIAWQADGRQLAIAGDFELLRVDRPAGILRQRVAAAASLLAGPAWITIAREGVAMWSWATGAELGRFAGFEPPTSGRLIGSVDGSRLLIASRGEVRLVALPAGETTATIRDASLARLATDGTRVAVAIEDDGGARLRVVEPGGGTGAERRYALDELRGVEAGPNRTWLVLGMRAVELLDGADLEPRGRLEVPFAPLAVTVSRRGDRIAVSGGVDDRGTLVVFDAGTRAEVARLALRGTAGQVWLADDGTLAVHINKAAVEVYRAGASVPALVVRHVGERAAALSPDGSRLLVGTKHGALELWDVASGSLVETQRAHRAAIASVDWIDDARFVLLGQDGTATRWELPRVLPSTAEISKLAESLPWRVEAGGLVRR